MGKAPDSVLQKNLLLAHPNRELVFRGVLEIPCEFRGKDALYMRVIFSDGVKINQFNPEDVIRKKSELAVRWGSLCEALGLDFNDIPFCHDWESFVQAFIKFTFKKRGMMVYAKLTVDENGWLVLGTGRCFSTIDDLEYSDEDRENLQTDEMDGKHKMKAETPY